ncbi:MAG: O-acetyl-ADP-ribose deacetylase [Clostridiales bacterium]|nr:O-acetyl-ADP-ribose deacetylase [Clostridiales bacterium]
MPFRIVLGNITKLNVDAIVNAANKSLLGGGGVDGAIHRAAGPRLLEECKTLNGCETGEAKITGGYDLPARYVIHTVGPIWTGGRRGEPQKLMEAYQNSLNLALENNCESIAFPLISSGAYGYPLDGALEIAVRTIRHFLEEHEMDVILVIFDKNTFRMSQGLWSDVSAYVKNNCEQEERKGSFLGDIAKSISFGGVSGSRRSVFAKEKKASDACVDEEAPSLDEEAPRCAMSLQAEPKALAMAGSAVNSGLKEALENLDESFSQALLRMIDERGMKDSDCYKKANIDRKLFSKIRSDIHYRPSKQTALALAVALELDLPETEAFLKKAGFALSHANKADVIVEYFITNKNYDMYSINEALFAFDQNLLGA